MTAIAQKSTSTSGQFVEAYMLPASGVQYGTVTLSILNRHTTDATIQVAVGQAVNPSNADYFEDGAKIPANGGKYEYECMILTPGEKILVKADNANCSIRVHGLIKVA